MTQESTQEPQGDQNPTSSDIYRSEEDSLLYILAEEEAIPLPRSARLSCVDVKRLCRK